MSTTNDLAQFGRGRIQQIDKVARFHRPFPLVVEIQTAAGEAAGNFKNDSTDFLGGRRYPLSPNGKHRLILLPPSLGMIFLTKMGQYLKLVTQ
jgi:hypothetical protein